MEYKSEEDQIPEDEYAHSIRVFFHIFEWYPGCHPVHHNENYQNNEQAHDEAGSNQAQKPEVDKVWGDGTADNPWCRGCAVYYQPNQDEEAGDEETDGEWTFPDTLPRRDIRCHGV